MANFTDNYMDPESGLRQQLAACYRIFDYLGWGELIYNHITVKIPGTDDQFLINPFGLLYSEIKATNLIKVDFEGNILQDTPHKVNLAGILIHSAIHAARVDIHCIAHTHTTAGMTIACQQTGLRTDNFYSVLLHNKIAYHNFEGITVQAEEKPRLIANLGSKNIMILRNHGLLTGGGTIAEAFYNMWILQRACEIQTSVDQTGKLNTHISNTIAEKSADLRKIQLAGREVGGLEFAAMVRKMELIDPSFRD